jgi:hypothetical protein
MYRQEFQAYIETYPNCANLHPVYWIAFHIKKADYRPQAKAIQSKPNPILLYELWSFPTNISH